MLHANVGYKARYDVYFSSMAPLLRLGTLQNSHCAALPGSISVHVSFGKFLCLLTSLLSDHSAQVLDLTVGLKFISLECLTSVLVHWYFAGTSCENPKHYALLALFA